ncbi:hypothetical protein BT69DRAFT_727757 [Atractiella rhizophila]|nr:hypothetical protein BT69DRAFT_727757 [Atractiella rhizophila]
MLFLRTRSASPFAPFALSGRVAVHRSTTIWRTNSRAASTSAAPGEANPRTSNKIGYLPFHVPSDWAREYAAEVAQLYFAPKNRYLRQCYSRNADVYMAANFLSKGPGAENFDIDTLVDESRLAKLQSFQPFFLPFWYLSLAANLKLAGKGGDEESKAMFLSSMSITLPAFTTPILSDCPILDTRPIPEDRCLPFSSYTSTPTSISSTPPEILPFSIVPTNMISKLIESTGGALSKEGSESILLAYPVYQPVYLAEFARKDKESERVTILLKADRPLSLDEAGVDQALIKRLALPSAFRYRTIAEKMNRLDKDSQGETDGGATPSQFAFKFLPKQRALPRVINPEPRSPATYIWGRNSPSASKVDEEETGGIFGIFRFFKKFE